MIGEYTRAMTKKLIGVAAALALALALAGCNQAPVYLGTWDRIVVTPRDEPYRKDEITFFEGKTVSVQGYRDLFKGTYEARSVNGQTELEIFDNRQRPFARASFQRDEMTMTYTFFQPAKFKKRK
jgi:hypothetical protein